LLKYTLIISCKNFTGPGRVPIDRRGALQDEQLLKISPALKELVARKQIKPMPGEI
jgi:hypothetical protein